MQSKPTAVIIVLLLVVTSLSVSGCTTNTTDQTPSASATTSAATHDAFLENYLEARKTEAYSNKNLNITKWEVEWINSTSARVAAVINSTNATINRTITTSWTNTFIVFPTTQDATDHLNAMNKTEYSLTSAEYKLQTYQNVTGHAPQVYKHYAREVYPDVNVIKTVFIEQLDNLIVWSS